MQYHCLYIEIRSGVYGETARLETKILFLFLSNGYLRL